MKFEIQKLKLTLLALIVLTGLGCIEKNNDEIIGEKIIKNSQLISHVKLSNQLREISGLACTKDGRVFCHNDEKGVVYEIDPKSGKILKRFQLGSIGIEADFEGIAIVGTTFYLVDSRGTLYNFNEGGDLENVKVESRRVGFSSKFEIEGLCYNPDINALLFACKEYPGKNFKGYRTVFAYSLDKQTLLPKPIIKIDLDEIKKELGKDDFYPSGIEYNNSTKTYFVISSKSQQVIAEFSSSGELKSIKKLKNKYHQQPEGITFLPDGRMIISDEGGNGKATITIYPAANQN
jgi:uncharacterized protein YjiK